jgi:peptide/nickel transport system substrate-binding protein
MNEIIGLHARNIWLVGTVGENPSLVIVRTNFRNVPERLVSDNGLMTPGNAEPEQFFIRQ